MCIQLSARKLQEQEARHNLKYTLNTFFACKIEDTCLTASHGDFFNDLQANFINNIRNIDSEHLPFTNDNIADIHCTVIKITIKNHMISV